MSESKKTNKTRNDIILIGAILLIVAVAFAVFKLTMQDGGYVTVSVNGDVVQTYSIAEEIETTITTGDNNEQTNVLVITNGEAFVKSANCPDGICFEHRPISKDGETIVCLPHKVVVAVTNEE